MLKGKNGVYTENFTLSTVVYKIIWQKRKCPKSYFQRYGQ